MRNWLDGLNPKERKNLILILVLVCIGFLYFTLLGGREKRSHDSRQEFLTVKLSELERMDLKKQEREKDWRKWEQTHVDIETLRAEYFYPKDDFLGLRRDLQALFNTTGIRATGLKYEYTEFEKEQIKKAKVTFSTPIGYASLKKFIHTVEELPKFLMVEKIDFLNIDRQGGFKVRITLAAYYGN